MDRIIDLAAHRAGRENIERASKPTGAGSAPVTSLPLVLRSAPNKFHPGKVALDLLATKSNAAAAPVWASRKADFLALLSRRGQRGPAARKIAAAWVEAVACAGVTEKRRRRQELEAEIAAAEKFFNEEFG